MFDFYVACVRYYSSTIGDYYWLPKKVYSDRSSCLRFFKSYKCNSLELPVFGIFRIYQDDIKEVNKHGKD